VRQKQAQQQSSSATAQQWQQACWCTMADAAAADRAAMPPPPARPGSKRKVVLEEDTFAEAIEAIIERDFFPALPKLQNQLEWLQAVQSGDPAQIKRAQLNIARRRAGLRTPLAHDGTAAPGTAALTPGTGLLRTPAMTPAVGVCNALQAAATPARTPAGAAAAAALQQQGVDPVSAQQAVGAKAPSLGLDQFFSAYQGEDNASFQEIQKKSIERKRAKMVHHLQDKNTPLLLEAGGHSTDEYGTSGQAPSTVLSTKHEPKSALYYDSSQRQALALTAAEQATIVQGPPKSINLAATRSICAGPLQEPLAAPPAAAARGSGAVAAAAGDIAAAAAAVAGEGSAEQRQADRLAAAAVAPGTRGYGYMKTPQIVPGVDASPLMTWGDIASTPLRLDGMDADIEGLGVLGDDDGAPGRQFTMPQVRTREVAAQQMHASRSAAGKRRAGAGGSSSGLGGRPGSTTPLLDSLRRGSSGVTGQRSGAAGSTPVHGLSVAGLKLAKQLGKGSRPGTGARAGGGAGIALGSSSADLQLRASYKGGSSAAATPVRVGAGVAVGSWDMTPGRAAAGAGSSRQLSGKVHVQPGSGAGGRAAAAKLQLAAGANVTDDLLKLS
jgi:protein DGCR14